MIIETRLKNFFCKFVITDQMYHNIFQVTLFQKITHKICNKLKLMHHF